MVIDLSGTADARAVEAAGLRYLHVPLEGDFAIYELDTPWNEATVTWDNQPSYSTVPVITRSAEAADGDQRSWWSFDITDLVADWAASPDDNHGIVLLNESQGPEVRFTSSENVDDARRRPRLVVFP